MTQFSHSRVETYKENPLQYKLRYIDKLKTIPDDSPTNPLYLGLGLHKGIETTVEEGIQEYYSHYNIITNTHIQEALKMEYWIPKVQEEMKHAKGRHEIKLVQSDFIGYIDFVEENDDGTVNLIDFKYSNNVNNYVDSPQLHLYKYFYEKQFKRRVKELKFLFVPKTFIRYKNNESEREFRQRIMETLDTLDLTWLHMEYNPNKVIEWYADVKKILEATEYPLNPDAKYWKYSEYYDYIEKGIDWMILPKYQPNNPNNPKKKTLWIYGEPFTGKTTFASQFPKPLLINTDGNWDMSTATPLPIADRVEKEGRREVTKFAWDDLKQAITDLENEDHEFETLIVDLVEDTYQHCRNYMYDKLGISHESDDSFKAWDQVTNEFLNVYKRLMNIKSVKNIILISHEDKTRDIMKKSGENITAINPNIRDKVAPKLAGMVQLVGRTLVENGEHVLSFYTDEVTFGGGRLTNVEVEEIPLDYKEYLKLFDEEPEEIEDEDLEEELEEDDEESVEEEPSDIEEDETEEDEDEEELTLEEITDMTVTELKELAEELDLDLPRRIKKAGLIELIAEELGLELPEEEEEEETEEEEEPAPARRGGRRRKARD